MNENGHRADTTPPQEPTTTRVGWVALTHLEREAIRAGARAAVLEARVQITTRLQSGEPPACVAIDLDHIVNEALGPLVRILNLLDSDRGLMAAGSAAWSILAAALEGDLDGYRALMAQRPPELAPDPDRAA